MLVSAVLHYEIREAGEISARSNCEQFSFQVRTYENYAFQTDPESLFLMKRLPL